MRRSLLTNGKNYSVYFNPFILSNPITNNNEKYFNINFGSLTFTMNLSGLLLFKNGTFRITLKKKKTQ